MAKSKRIYDISKELVNQGAGDDSKTINKKIIAYLESQGIEGKTPSSSIDEDEEKMILDHLLGKKSPSKSMEKKEAKEEVKPETKEEAKNPEKPQAKEAVKREEKPREKEEAGSVEKPVPKAVPPKKPVSTKPGAGTPSQSPAGKSPVLVKKKKSNIIFSTSGGNYGGGRQVGQINRGKIEDPYARPRGGFIKPSIKPSPTPEASIIRPNQQPKKRLQPKPEIRPEEPRKTAAPAAGTEPKEAPARQQQQPPRQAAPQAAGTARPAQDASRNTARTEAPARSGSYTQGRSGSYNVRRDQNGYQPRTGTQYVQRPQGTYSQGRGDGSNYNRGFGAGGNNQNRFGSNARPQNKAGAQGRGGAFGSAPSQKDGGKNRSDDRRRQNEKRKRDNSFVIGEDEKERKRSNPHKFNKPAPVQKPPEEEIKVITIPDTLTIKELADHMKMQPSVIIKKLFLAGKVVTVNSEIDYEEAENIAIDYEIMCEHEKTVDVIAELLKEDEEDESRMEKRPPVVCVMGHVDHGKTSLLDTIRKSHVTEKEAGGITQAIGAYTVSINDRKITFLDTPGHEAFTAMRMRGANATDIVILVVAADDGVMPQTVEAISHAKAAGVEIIVAINKIDKPNANPDRVKQELSEHELIPEDWGGSTIFVPVSAKAGTGVDDLLEMILLTADVMELKADRKRKARGMVIEAELDKGRGPVATVLVQKGTLHVGDFVAVGPCHGKVRAMIDDKGRRVKEAGPSIPVEILGLDDVPDAGEIFVSPETEKEAQNFANTYKEQHKRDLLSETKKKNVTLEQLYKQIKEGELKEFNVVIKADVQGSVEALKTSLLKLSNEEVAVDVIYGGVGTISESDVTLASASNAVIIGFNVRPDSTAKAIAEAQNVDIRLYKIIYQAIEDVESAMKGMLAPVYEEKVIGHGEIRQIFKASGIGNIAGSYVTDGIVERGCSVKITRGDEELFDGPLSSLKRFKDDVKEVREGYECGLVFDGFDKVEEGDLLEFHKTVEVERT
ncbi:MAG: translation initiation factor IF-2 [Lachnospiraceae bacterium]|nr:translation initiation factor IF-2 [Lachnospiraceae bacterium]